mgnify:CR=1 FL=1
MPLQSISSISRERPAVVGSHRPIAMETSKLLSFVDGAWETDIVPQLVDYIRIPNKSPVFDPDWAANGHMDRADDERCVRRHDVQDVGRKILLHLLGRHRRTLEDLRLRYPDLVWIEHEDTDTEGSRILTVDQVYVTVPE